jgi:hypothetical protein
VQVLQKASDLPSDDVKASLQRAESNLNALNTVDLRLKRPFSVGECALWARLTGPQLAAQVAAAVSLVEAHSNYVKAAALGARAALAAELPKEPGGGAGGIAKGDEEIPGRPLFCVGGREELKTRCGSLSSEEANAEVQAERSTPIKVLRSLE